MKYIIIYLLQHMSELLEQHIKSRSSTNWIYPKLINSVWISKNIII